MAAEGVGLIVGISLAVGYLWVLVALYVYLVSL